MRGQEGVFDTTRLVRRSPFGEWVNVYFDPAKVTEAKLLKAITANRCPRAELVQPPKRNALLNEFAAPGDVVQFRYDAPSATTLTAAVLPEGWQLLDAELESAIKKGTNHLSVRVPDDAKQGTLALSLTFADCTTIKGRVAVVQQVGKH